MVNRPKATICGSTALFFVSALLTYLSFAAGGITVAGKDEKAPESPAGGITVAGKDEKASESPAGGSSVTGKDARAPESPVGGSSQASKDAPAPSSARVESSLERVSGAGGATELIRQGGVFVFYDPACPICLEYFPTIQKLAAANRDLLPFYLVMRKADDGAAEKFRKEYKPSCRILIDEDTSLRKALEATATPQAFLVHAGKTLYSGRIDNRYESIGHRRNVISSNDLADALSLLRKGTDFEIKKTSPVGCFLGTISSNNSELTYSDDIAPLFMNRCVVCHQPGGVAPFSLHTYDEVKKRLPTIDAVVAGGIMPPWKPRPGFGSFANARCLTQEEKDSIHKWIQAGAPAGNLKDVSPIPPEIIQSSGDWKSGKPDIVVKMDRAYKVPADGPDIYRCFVFPLGNDAAKFVSHVEFHPGNPKVAHHALFFLDNTGTARKKDEADPQPGFSSFGGPGFLPTGALGGWAPGNSMLPLPDGVGRLLRQGSDLVIQMHFHPDGKEELAQSELGIYFTKKPPKTLLLPLTIRSRKIDIPAGEKNYTVSASTTVPADFDLLQVTPHAHLLCKEIKCDATTPDGQKLPLIWIKNWDFNWQEQYAYQKPIHLPAGTVVNAKFVYDNSSDNYRNPHNPPQRVGWGEQTTDEMALIFFGGTVTRNEEMAKYMRGLLLESIRDLPQLGVKPGQAFKAIRVLLGKNGSPIKLLQKANSQIN